MADSKSLPPRRSERITKGVPPARYTSASQNFGNVKKAIMNFDEVSRKPEEETDKNLQQTSSKTNKSSKRSSNKSRRQRQLEIEFEKEKRLAEIEKRLIEREAEMKKAELESLNSSDFSNDEKETIASKTSFVQDWVNSLNKSAENLPNKKNVQSKESKHSDPEGGTAEELKIHQFVARQSFSKELPVFSGEPGEWMNFIHQFRETTKLCGFSDAENIVRLQKCLKGRARECVNALLIFTQEVDKIITTLERRYGRPEIIIEDLIDTVRKIPEMKEEKLESILDFSNKIQNLAITIESLKCQTYLSNPQLLNDVVKKLNPNLKMEWGRRVVELKKCSKSISITDFSIWLEEMSEAIMHVVGPEKEPEKRRKFVCTTSQPESKVFKCKYCKKDGHKLESCKSFKKLDIEKRWDWVRDNKVCFTCLGSSHHTKFCRSKKKCEVDGCFFKHHALLHREFDKKPEEVEEQVNHHVNSAQKTKILLRIAPVELIGPRGKFNTFALFDEASTITMIDADLADKIGATGPSEPLRIKWTNSMTSEEQNSKKVYLKIKGQNEDITYSMNNVRTVENLCLPVQSIDIKNISDKLDYLQKVRVTPLVNAKPLILIGQDNINLIIAREVHEGGKNDPVLSRSKLGWVVHGNLNKNYLGRVDEEFIFFVNHQHEKLEELEELVRNSFKIDNLGVKYYKKVQSPDDIRATAILKKTTRRINSNKWETGLLWKSDHFNLPNSKFTALNRLKSLEKRMDKDEEFAVEYSAKISEYLEKGYARKLSSEEVQKKWENIWYLPHFAVTNPNKPGKIRFVFDAAAKSSGISLNDVLLKGPDLLNSLLGVIFKFRQRNIAVSADIQEMFHRVEIRPKDRNAQRFLWRGRERDGKIPAEYEMIAMIFGAVSSPTSAQYVMRTNALEFENDFPEAVKAIRECHYVDDYLDSFDTVEEARKITSDVIEVHRRGGFTIRNWTSNSREVLKTIPGEYRNCNEKDMDLEKESPLAIQRILGLFWNPNEDRFAFSIKWNKDELRMLAETPVTKRDVLRTVMTIFDPFGFLSAFTIIARILLQDIWRTKIGWDDHIREDMMTKWKKWITKIEKFSTLTIPRCYIPNLFDAQEIQLHIFCDASAQAYSTVAYFRVTKNESIDTCFVMAKSRVTPIKQQVSIPRLELQAAVLGSRLAVTIIENHSIKINKCFYWTDSKTVIGWIKAESTIFKPFVAHRVAEIIETTGAKNWNWVPTKENVADEATRENSLHHWESGSRWLNGPHFLKYEKEKWPQIHFDEIDTSEVKKQFVGATSDRNQNLKEALPDITRFSSWLKLIRATAWMLRFIGKSRKTSTKTKELMPIEMNSAEILWIRNVQNEHFQEEIDSLKRGRKIETSSKLYKLSPIIDNEGILRIESRVLYSNDLAQDTKFPIILDPKNDFTRLLIFHHHIKAAHNGQEYVVNELRQRYWILNMRSAVRRCWSKCQFCKNNRAKPEIPEMAPLPNSRLTSFVRPFTIVGMDYFGPMFVSIGRRREKRYGVLFTCMSTRAVHFEMAHSLTTDSAIMAIRRLVGRRGCPKKIFSDNGTNLRGAAKELKTSLEDFDQNEIISKLTTSNIEFFFIPPSAPHMGGSWERLIRSIKTTLKVILKEKFPREEVLQTLLIEAESIVNSRPLVHVSLDHADSEALTPNHFLLGTSSATQIPGKFDENDLFTRKQWRISQLLSDHFWRRWIREYLPVLTKRTKWFSSSQRKIKIGDVVIIVDNQFSRNTWPKGIVTAVHPGRDGHIRVVDVKTSMGTYRRPLTKLCILDIDKPNDIR